MSAKSLISYSNYSSFEVWKNVKSENYMPEYMKTKFGSENRLRSSEVFTFLFIFHTVGFTWHTRYVLYSTKFLENESNHLKWKGMSCKLCPPWLRENEASVLTQCEWMPRGKHSTAADWGTQFPLNNSESLMEIRSTVSPVEEPLFWVTQYSASYSRALENNNNVKGKKYFNGIPILLGCFLGMKFPTSWQPLPLWRDEGEGKKSIFKSETARNFREGCQY